MNPGAFPWLVLEDVLSAMVDGSIEIDPMDTFIDEQKKMVRIEDAQAARSRKLTSIWSGEVFPAGVVILQEEGSTHRTKRDVVVAVTKDDLVVLDADVLRDPDGEVGRIRRADVVGVRMVDDTGNPVAMMQSRDVLELDEPERTYIVAVDRRVGDATVSDAFVFRSLSVADEARRDFERNLVTTA